MQKYYISYTYNKDGESGYGSVVLNSEFILNDLQSIETTAKNIEKEYSHDVVVILNFIKLN